MLPEAGGNEFKEFPGEFSRALLQSGYIDRVSRQARERRKQREVSKPFRKHSSASLKETVERLREELKKKQLAEAKLLDVNR